MLWRIAWYKHDSTYHETHVTTEAAMYVVRRISRMKVHWIQFGVPGQGLSVMLRCPRHRDATLTLSYGGNKPNENIWLNYHGWGTKDAA